MRFDLIDEHSTLVPFGLGVSKHNRVIQPPAGPAEPVAAAKPSAISTGVSRLKTLFLRVAALGRVGGLQEFKKHS